MKKTVDNFQPAGGMHCITNAMKQIFNFYGHPLSEEMLFGLGEGLDFAYINMAHSPMVSGRSKIMEFEGILSKRLGVGMKFRKGRDNNKSFEAARKMIDGNQPVLIMRICHIFRICPWIRTAISAAMPLYCSAMMTNRAAFTSVIVITRTSRSGLPGE